MTIQYLGNFVSDLRHIHLDDLTYDPALRQRQNIEAARIDEMIKSIRELGIISPIAVYQPPGSSPPYKIIAGITRYTACRELGMDTIPCRVFTEHLSEDQLWSIELEENLRRTNLTDAERDMAIAELHEILERMALQKGEVHRQLDTAIVLGISQPTISNAIKMREDLKRITGADPKGSLAHMSSAQVRREIKKFDSKIDNEVIAIKARQAREATEKLNPTPRPDVAGMLKEMEALDKKSKSGTTGGDGSNTSKLTQKLFDLLDSYICGDFFENDLESGQFALIECDPPYGINLPELRDTEDSSAFKEYHEIEASEYPAFMRRLCEEMYRLASPASYVVLWHTLEYKELINQELERAGFSVRKHQCGIWMKGNAPGQQYQPDINLGNSCEYFTYASKGNARLMTDKKGRSNIFNFNKVAAQRKRHPTERPIELMNEIIATFGSPRAQVLVPFAGSGVTLIAASLKDMPVVGYDLESDNRNAFIKHVMSMPEFKQLQLI